MSVALGGNLRDFGIAEVFQLIGQQQKTGLLEITSDSKTMRLAFDAGAVVWASPMGASPFAVLGDQLVRSGLLTQQRLQVLSDESQASARPLPGLLTATGAVTEDELSETRGLLTSETIFEVLRWSEGSFHFSAQSVTHDLPPEKLLAAEQILMDGLRKIDEWQLFSGKVPSDASVFRRVGPIEAYRQRVRGDGRSRLAQAERIYQLVDGRLPVRRIIDLSRLGTFEATRVLAELVDEGVVAPLDTSQVKAAGRSELRLRPMMEHARSGLGVVAPLALLVGIVAISFGVVLPPAPPPQGFPIVRNPLAEARTVFESRRLRHAIHTQRFLTGHWPKDLDEVQAIVGPSSDLLQFSAPGPAYYVRGEDGVTLLAPER